MVLRKKLLLIYKMQKIPIYEYPALSSSLNLESFICQYAPTKVFHNERGAPLPVFTLSREISRFFQKSTILAVFWQYLDQRSSYMKIIGIVGIPRKLCVFIIKWIKYSQSRNINKAKNQQMWKKPYLRNFPNLIFHGAFSKSCQKCMW